MVTLLVALALLMIAASAMQLTTASYIPPKDADFDTWATNFSALLTASPATYGLVAGDAATVAAAYTPWHTAYLAANNFSTRGPSTVQTKNTAKVNLLAIVRPYAQLISNNAGVSPTAKVNIGVNPRTTVPAPIVAPTSFPLLALRGGTPLQLTMAYSDSAAPDGKAKPYGALQLQVFAQVSATVITDPAAITFHGAATKSPFVLDFESGDANKIAYIAARYVTRTGLVGPWSAIQSATVMTA